MHGCGHVIDSVSPARLITGHRSHASFKSVAGRAYAEQRLFSVRLGQQLFSLIKREVVPVHHSLHQSKFVGGSLTGVEDPPSVRVALVPDGLHANLILPGRQVFDSIVPRSVGEHAERYLGFRVLSLDEGSLEGCAVRPFDCTDDGSRPGRRSEENRQSHRSYEPAHRAHKPPPSRESNERRPTSRRHHHGTRPKAGYEKDRHDYNI